MVLHSAVSCEKQVLKLGLFLETGFSKQVLNGVDKEQCTC
jgi:hypothetical protein